MKGGHGVILFISLLFACGTLISLTFGGAWVGPSELSVVNSLAFKEASFVGWAFPMPNFDFFFTGFKSLMVMDYGFFSGTGYSMLGMFFIMVFSLGALWVVYLACIAVTVGIFRRRWGH